MPAPTIVAAEGDRRFPWLLVVAFAVIPASILVAWRYPPGGAFLFAAIFTTHPVLLVKWRRTRHRSDLISGLIEALNVAALAFFASTLSAFTPAICTATALGTLTALTALLLAKRLNLYPNEAPA